MVVEVQHDTWVAHALDDFLATEQELGKRCRGLDSVRPGTPAFRDAWNAVLDGVECLCREAVKVEETLREAGLASRGN